MQTSSHMVLAFEYEKMGSIQSLDSSKMGHLKGLGEKFFIMGWLFKELSSTDKLKDLVSDLKRREIKFPIMREILSKANEKDGVFISQDSNSTKESLKQTNFTELESTQPVPLTDQVFISVNLIKISNRVSERSLLKQMSMFIMKAVLKSGCLILRKTKKMVLNERSLILRNMRRKCKP